jgi:hypothetical protein
MNLAGKILTVFILVMSLVFMAMAVAVYAPHKNWKTTVEAPKSTTLPRGGLKAQLTDKEAERQQLQDKLDKAEILIKAETSAREVGIAKAEGENVSLKEELVEARKRLNELQEHQRKYVGAAEEATKETTSLRNEFDTIKNELVKAQEERDAAFKKMLEATDKMNSTALEVSRMKELNAKLSEEVAKFESVLLKLGGSKDPEFYKDWPPKVDGVIKSISTRDLVTISLGSDDGLRPGHQLEVSRVADGNATYLGRIEVVRTAPDESVCKILPEYSKSNVLKGDRVFTKQQ